MLFKPFAQADLSTTRKYGGTGLGLVISHNIVQMMDGDIWLDSKEGEGSIFYFKVTLKKYNESEAINSFDTDDKSEINKATAILKGSKILLVEDNEINQEITRDILSLNGITIKIANNGAEALEILENDTFDGVLMDCMMPIMDGYEATKKIRQQSKYSDLPIIAMTANSMEGDREKALEVGMNDHISKPIIPNIMLMTMAKWIEPKLN